MNKKITNGVMYFDERESRGKLDEIKKLYEQILNCNMSGEGYYLMKKLISDLIKFQKSDGSFSTIESYECDGDIRVEYAYMPTYYATAAMMHADLQLVGGLEEYEIDALRKGLYFALGRQLVGHGFDATDSLIKTLRIYAKAGMYKWINVSEEAKEFKKVVELHYLDFVKNVTNGTTRSDWNRDFSKEYKREITDYEKYSPAYVWYAAYGSNINEERFMKYINRCEDKTVPVENMPYTINYPMYFGGMSRVWGGAVAFIDSTKTGYSFGRIYRIKKTQFEEIQAMEGKNYSKKMMLGYVNDIPVYTFTSETRKECRAMPSHDYITTIFEGLKETYPHKAEISWMYYLYTRGFVKEVDLAILEYIRECEHAKTVGELINETHYTKTCLTRSIKELHRSGLLVQDRRSAGVDITEENAMVYTCKEKRDLIDILTVME